MTLHIRVSSAKQICGLCKDIFNGTIVWDGPRGYDLPGVALKLARKKPELRFDVGSITQTGGISALAKIIGWDRLDLTDPDLPASFLAYAAAMPGIPKPKLYDKLIGFPKIDTHWHTGSWKIGFEPRATRKCLSADIFKFGIKIAITSSIVALDGDLIEGNCETKRFCDLDQNVRGMVVVNPERVEQSILEIEKYKHLFVGLKTIQDEFKDGLRHPGYLEILAHAPRDWPLMAHLPGLAALAKEMPERTFIAAHSTWEWKPLLELPNVFFDIATSARHDLGALIKKAPYRVLFSSDAPLISPAFTLGKLAALDLPNFILRRILWNNAQVAFPRLRTKIDSLARQKPPTMNVNPASVE